MTVRRTNWAGNHVIAGGPLHEPRSMEELQDLVAGRRRLRVVGTGHTFNSLPDGLADLVSLAAMPRRLDIAADGDAGTVTVDAAVRYADLGEPLEQAGLALEAMASLGHISVAGACATGSHGSGDRTMSLAAAVTGLGMVAASGEYVELRGPRAGELPGLVVGLGALGIVTDVTLRVVPSRPVRQEVVEDVSLHVVLDRFDAVTSVADSVSLFTLWRDRTFHQAWCKHVGAEGPEPAAVAAFLGGRAADGARHPIPGHDPAACTTQLGIPGPWHERLPHFRADRTPSSGRELQSEYLLDRVHATQAVAALFEAADGFASMVQVSEVRTVARDDHWLSPASGRATVAIHFTWRPELAAVLDAIDVVERVLEPFDPRPHWGKLWRRPVEAVRASYPRFSEVVALRDTWDPERRFANRYVDTLLGG